MTKAEAYLAKLKHEKELWAAKVEELPGDTISVNHPAYKMSVNAANKYAAAAYMYKLMSEETDIPNSVEIDLPDNIPGQTVKAPELPKVEIPEDWDI